MTSPPAVDPLAPDRIGPEAVRRYLKAHRLAARKSLSQNFLVDGDVLRDIVAAAAPAPARRILEIGPGIGALTGALLSAGADVTAVEVDERLAAHLRERHAGAIASGQPAGRLRLVHGDVLDLPLDELAEPPYDAVANLPYHITSPVLHALLGGEPRPERFVLMLQREVAERIAASPGEMSYLSVFVQYHARVELVRIVPPDAFEPSPQVDSAVLAGDSQRRRLDAEREAELWRLVQAAFRERRKMLHNVLTRQLRWIPRARIEAALAAARIAHDRRPQTVSVDEWLALAEALGPLGEAR